MGEPENSLHNPTLQRVFAERLRWRPLLGASRRASR